VSNLAAALDIVGARWALLVVERLLDGPQRYGDLQRDLGVPTNMLATRLRELEAAGVLSRLPLRHNTRAYALTDRGLALREAIVALARWGGEEWPRRGAESRCAPTSSPAATALAPASPPPWYGSNQTRSTRPSSASDT
jgi:DNA-binding HxlR family transcriptional regulator